MINDEDDDHVLDKDTPESLDGEFARSIRVRDAARRAFVLVDADRRLRKAAAAASRPNCLTLELRALYYFQT